jgi:hypothetical protein
MEVDVEARGVVVVAIIVLGVSVVVGRPNKVVLSIGVVGATHVCPNTVSESETRPKRVQSGTHSLPYSAVKLTHNVHTELPSSK